MSAAMIKMLGPKLLSKDGEVPTGEALKGKSTVALYFSAHWCGPCRGFTPELAKAYSGAYAAKGMEIVFVSSDRDEGAFADYFGGQPWLALPYSERKLKAALSKKFKVQGIPSLVVLDSATGETLCRDGRSEVMADPKGERLPWRPPTIWEALGDEFLASDGETVELEELRGENKVIGLYFSAHWCPPCQRFTPSLVKTYEALRKAGKQLELIFVSSDRDMGAFQEYFRQMPWLAIPPGDKRKAALSSLFDVSGIPTLVLVDGASGETITTDARGAVDSDPEGVDFPWHPKPLKDLDSTADGLNDETCLCVLAEACPVEVQAELEAALTGVAEAAKAAADDSVLYFLAKKSEEQGGNIAPQIRRLTKLGAPAAVPQMLLLDIPDEGGFYVSDAKEITADSVAAFLAAFKAGTLERQQLG